MLSTTCPITTSVMRIDRALSRYGSRGLVGAGAGAFGVAIMCSDASNEDRCSGTITLQRYGPGEGPFRLGGTRGYVAFICFGCIGRAGVFSPFHTEMIRHTTAAIGTARSAPMIPPMMVPAVSAIKIASACRFTERDMTTG